MSWSTAGYDECVNSNNNNNNNNNNNKPYALENARRFPHEGKIRQNAVERNDNQPQVDHDNKVNDEDTSDGRQSKQQGEKRPNKAEADSCNAKSEKVSTRMK